MSEGARMKRDKYLVPYKIFTAIGRPIFWLKFRPLVINKENIPKSGSVIFCANHRHHLDPFCAIYSTKRIIHYTAKKELMDGTDALVDKPNSLVRKLNAWMLKCAGTISINRDGDTSDAMDCVAEYLINGSAIGLFPEGTRNKTANEYELQPFKFGAVSLAKKTGADILPFAITGKYKKGKGLTIRFGEPFKVGNRELEDANNDLRERILALIQESRQGAAN